MSNVTFDGVNKTITLNGLGAYSATDIYSSWKQWVATGINAGYVKAFETTGGDPVGLKREISPYYFLSNQLGWTINMPEEDGEVDISGNLYPRDASLPMFVQATGYNVFLRMEVSLNAHVITEVGSLTQEQNDKLNSIKNNTGLIPALL